MSWTTPPTFVASDTLAAAELNILTDDLTYLKGITDGVSFSGAKVARSSNQSIPDSVETNVTFTSESFDFGGWWSSGASAVVPAGAIPAGFTTIIAQVVAYIRFVANGTGTRQVAVMHNAAIEDACNVSAISGEMTTVYLTSFFEVAAGDTIGVGAYQSSGGALNMNAAHMTVVRFAPAS